LSDLFVGRRCHTHRRKDVSKQTDKRSINFQFKWRYAWPS